jgi:hypothetical protein
MKDNNNKNKTKKNTNRLNSFNNELETISNKNNNNIDNSLLVININNIKELESVEALTEEQLASWWTLVISCPDIPMKERLAASDKLAKYRGMFERGKTIATSGGAVYKWKTAVEAEIVHDTETK